MIRSLAGASSDRASHAHLLLAALVAAALAGTATAQRYLVNAGGGSYRDRVGRVFLADRAYTPGSFGHVSGAPAHHAFPVRGTTDDPLYQSARAGASFRYLFDGLPSGLYEVRLFFCEPTATRAGQRTFTVRAEGTPVLTDYDIFLYGGSPSSLSLPFVGLLEACCEVFTTDVLDGQLEIGFDVETGSGAVVSAIAVSRRQRAPLARYVDVTRAVGIAHDNTVSPFQCRPDITTGSAWADFDGDSRVDLYVTNNGGANLLYRNLGDVNGDGLPDFIDVAAAMGVDDPGGLSHCCVFVDYDNDGDQDLFVGDQGANVLFQNQLVPSGAAGFVDVTAASGLADSGRTTTAAWGDFDLDGHLDVYLAKHYVCEGIPGQDALYRNNGDGTFRNVTSLLCNGRSHCERVRGLGFSAAWVDLDDDGDQDLYLVNDNIQLNFQPCLLWRNDGPGPQGWTFVDVSPQSGAGVSVNGMGLGVGDFDNDGRMDLAFSNVGPNNLLRNAGGGVFEDWSALMGIQRAYLHGINDPTREQWTWGSVFFDHDNDGWLDLFFVGGYLDDKRVLIPGAFFWNARGESFVDLTDASGLGVRVRGRNASTADFDGDGFVDVFLNQLYDPGVGPYKSSGTPLLFHNRARSMGNANHWLTVTVEGTRSNRDGIGTRIRAILPGGGRMVRDITSGPTLGGGDHRAAHFGLGGATSVTLEIRWPGGGTRTVGPLNVDRAYHVVEPP